jgi:crotonobetainyl-CoA:carnitine CoA-transferase CaiB-like acyl-CoA transferase
MAIHLAIRRDSVQRSTDYSTGAAEYQLGHCVGGAERRRTRGTDDALAALKKSAIPATPVNHTRELFDDPQVIANDLTAELSHSEWGRVQQTGMLTKFSATPGKIDRAAPMLGEHTDEILREYLGYSLDQIASLRAARIVR